MTASRSAASSWLRRRAVHAPPVVEAAAADAALIAELALTFDLDALVALAHIDPFRR